MNIVAPPLQGLSLGNGKSRRGIRRGVGLNNTGVQKFMKLELDLNSFTRFEEIGWSIWQGFSRDKINSMLNWMHQGKD